MEMMELKDLTLAGWLLVIITIVGGLGIGIPTLVILDYALPPGRYPRIVFLIPTIAIGAGIFFGGRAVLKMMGKSMTRTEQED